MFLLNFVLSSDAPSGAWQSDFALRDYLAVGSRVRESHLRPHPYATADIALRQLLDMRSDQAVYVAGESGAGKTEVRRCACGPSMLIAEHHVL